MSNHFPRLACDLFQLISEIPLAKLLHLYLIFFFSFTGAAARKRRGLSQCVLHKAHTLSCVPYIFG